MKLYQLENLSQKELQIIKDALTLYGQMETTIEERQDMAADLINEMVWGNKLHDCSKESNTVNVGGGETITVCMECGKEL
jgi:hypothetical protein